MLADLFQYIPSEVDGRGEAVPLAMIPDFTLERGRLLRHDGLMFVDGKFCCPPRDIILRIRALMKLFSINAIQFRAVNSDSLFQSWAHAEKATEMSLAYKLLSTEHVQRLSYPRVMVQDQTTKVTLALGVQSNHGLLSERTHHRDDGEAISMNSTTELENFCKRELYRNVCSHDVVLVDMLRRAAPVETDISIVNADVMVQSLGFGRSTVLFSEERALKLLYEEGHETSFDPVTKLELLLQGAIGSYHGILVYTDAMRPLWYRFLRDDECFVVGPPSHLGKLFHREDVSTSIDDKRAAITRHQTYSAYVFDKAVVRVG